ncbi:TIGR02266 family protein [Stigmatella erecta]|uniref:Myxococcus xanthus paralogous domain TIGR02266 n=1 Tax=Stigmatella erecta TaxID=83460 RepID=A0A1H9ZWY3_9BACT|nr:TIGR02266 family protein [Stigmatella erecta]SES85833.1 Myxococcus xanthus paralogous domain TIGR02266 [Stigmatella erecta]
MAPSEKLPPRPPRLEYELPVAYQSVSGFITDWAVNISRGGLFINTKKPLSVGSPVRLIVSLPGTKFPFDLTGRVTRINTAHEGANHVPGMAIEFVNVDDEKRALLEQFVDRLRAELPSDEAG